MSKLIKFFVQFFVVGVLFGQLANALECYTCNSGDKKECHKIGKDTEIESMECTLNAVNEKVPNNLNGIISVDFQQNVVGPIPMVCQKIVYTEGDKSFTYRGCNINVTSGVCAHVNSRLEQIGKSEIKITSCDVCSNEKCNFSSQIISDIRLVFVLVAFIKLFECRPNVVKQNTPEWLAEIISISNFGTDLEITVPMVCQKITAVNEKMDLLTYRGCQMHGGKIDLCSIAKSNAISVDNGIKIESCIVCEDDSCNGVGRMGVVGVIWMIMGIVGLVLN
ncbi:uncharacterized protein [Chironomus tepperi]|uniref:uncharacterized protein n=1 Tax=Chironomus tepperi TaxID=113505 RepID=UPI00391EE796